MVFLFHSHSFADFRGTNGVDLDSNPEDPLEVDTH